MQDSGAERSITAVIDIADSGAYPHLVTKDTSVELKNPQDASESSGTDASENESPMASAPHDPNAHDRARFLAAMQGSVSLEEYVQEVAANIDRQLPPVPDLELEQYQH